MPQKNTFDWMRQQLNGFMRTQIIAAAATLSLADYLQDQPRTVEEIASITGLEKEMTFRFLRALASKRRCKGLPRVLRRRSDSALTHQRASWAVDIGGAGGSLLYSLLQINPHLHGIVYDRQENVSLAQSAAISLGLSERSTAVAGDFFESVPEGDLYLLRFILHDWNDGDCIRILKNCRRAMLPNSRLVIIECFLGRVGQEGSHDMADTQGAIIDLHIFLLVGGRERSVSQYETLLQQADLSMTATTPLPSGYVLMEARAKG